MSRFDRIAGYESEKKELFDLCRLIKKYDEFSKRGFRLPRGILISGKPGVGKTVLAETLIEESGLYCEKVDFNAVDDDHMSEYLDNKFKNAIQNSPSIVFLDELDKYVGEPGIGFRNTYNMEATRKILKAINDNTCNDVMLIATVNNADFLCNALSRSGRFDKTIMVPLPDLDDRKAIIELYIAGKSIEKKVNINTFAKITEGFSGADIECVVNEAGLSSVLAERSYISQEDIDDAINKIVFKSSKKLKPLDQQIKDIVAIHEAGHLVAGLILNENGVGGASILPQGMAGGHVKISSCNMKIQKKSEILNAITVSLAGKAAEKYLANDDEYLGAASDIERAYDMAKELVTSGCGYGLEYYSKDTDSPFANALLSEDRLQKIEAKCYDVLEDCMQRATDLIVHNVELIKKYVMALKRYYTLTRDDIMRIYKRETKRREVL